jgi:hypothetical protein
MVNDFLLNNKSVEHTSSLLILIFLSISNKSFIPSKLTPGCQLIPVISRVGEFHAHVVFASLLFATSCHVLTESPSFKVEF